MRKSTSSGILGLPPAPRWADLPRRIRHLALLSAGLALAFSLPLVQLVQFCLHRQLYSYILLIPFISLYLVWSKSRELSLEFIRATPYAFLLTLAGLVFATAGLVSPTTATKAGFQDYLCFMTLSFVLLILGACAWLLGARTCRDLGFPLAFLLFMVPLSSGMESWVEMMLQHSSAEIAYLTLKLSGTPVFREGTTFILPDIRINVAPECSGIHSSLVLLIVGLLASQFFLRRTWSKWAMGIGVLALGILRNAVRIFVIAQLCVHVGPQMIDSDLHHHGGPVFFALSLVPFFLLIWLLRKLEMRKTASVQP